MTPAGSLAVVLYGMSASLTSAAFGQAEGAAAGHRIAAGLAAEAAPDGSDLAEALGVLVTACDPGQCLDGAVAGQIANVLEPAGYAAAAVAAAEDDEDESGPDTAGQLLSDADFAVSVIPHGSIAFALATILGEIREYAGLGAWS